MRTKKKFGDSYLCYYHTMHTILPIDRHRARYKFFFLYCIVFYRKLTHIF